MGIAKALSEVVGGDTDTVKSKMNAGPVLLDSAKFGLFLGEDELASSALLFDKKHIAIPESTSSWWACAGRGASCGSGAEKRVLIPTRRSSSQGAG